ncbi:MAG TPA: hypothetical protein VE978_12350 [Chitinophagales bacterium]|nr:hypothetical protein [Chitinophagales bacterium]
MKYLLPAILLSLTLNAFSQNINAGLFGLEEFNTQPITDSVMWGLTQYIPGTGETILLDTIGYGPRQFPFGPQTIDEDAHELYGVVGENNKVVLYRIDLFTAEVISTVVLESYPYIYSYTYNRPMMQYDWADKKLYTLFENDTYSSHDSVFIAEIDISTGTITPILFVDTGYIYGIHQGFDVFEKKIYCYTYSGSHNIIVYCADLNSLTVSRSSVPLMYENSSLALCYDYCTQKIYGDEAYFNGPNQSDLWHNRIIQINPATGSKIFLTDYFDAVLFFNAAVDPLIGHVYFSGLIANGSVEGIFDYNFCSGSKSFADSLSVPIRANLMIFEAYRNPSQQIVADFTSSNFCLNAPTFFSAEEVSCCQWNFGDEASGANNFSSLQCPQHIFSSNGDFMVTLIVSGCNGADTITKTISIHSFPAIDLGNDTVICTGFTKDPIRLSVPQIPGATYQWQDHSDDSVFFVTQPGLYSVSVRAECGVVSDSILISGVACSCDMFLNPSLCLSHTQAFVNCNINNFSELTLEIFNGIGQRIYSHAIVAQLSDLDMSTWAAGYYFYVFHSSGTIWSTGKFVVTGR